MDYTLESIVTGVDLRLPLAPKPILFRGGTPHDEEVVAAIRRSIGDGEIVTATAAEDAPRYTIFLSQDNGCVDVPTYEGINKCFRKHGLEACVFEYLRIEKIFKARYEHYFVSERLS